MRDRVMSNYMVAFRGAPRQRRAGCMTPRRIRLPEDSRKRHTHGTNPARDAYRLTFAAMFPRASARRLRGFVALVIGVMVVPLLTLPWLGWRLLEQDRALESQQVRQRVERAADLVVAALQRAITATEQRLIEDGATWPAGSIAVTFDEARVDVVPAERVAYWPVTPPMPEASTAAFAAAERLELRDENLGAAITAFARLERSADPAVSAGALLRLGRTLRKAGRHDEALAAYARLSHHDGVAVGGVPASLAAAYARGSLLEQLQRLSELRTEGVALEQQLRAGRWKLTSPVYALYTADAARWSGSASSGPSPQERLAAALGTAWSRWRLTAAEGRAPSGRESFDVGGETMTVLWQTSGGAPRALVGTAAFVDTAWLAPLAPILGGQHVTLALRDSTGKDVFGNAGSRAAAKAIRSVTDAALPWAVVTATVEPPPEERAFVQRRRWLIAGFVLMTTLALVASALIVRAVSRELAVARQQSNFVAAVSHEFRTPLTTLRQFTDMLREQPALDDGRRNQAYAAQARATDRLTRLVESLLDFGRMEAGVRSYRFATRDAAEFVAGVVDDFRAEPGAAEHDIAFRGGDTAPVAIDEEAMARAVRNLLENAVKYSPAPPRVDVALARRNGHVRISVRDRGLGIPAHERTRIFRKFQRGEQALARGIKGTGIGLAMVEEIVTAHHGRVDVESEAGQGSTFTIVLPSAPPPERHA